MTNAYKYSISFIIIYFFQFKFDKTFNADSLYYKGYFVIRFATINDNNYSFFINNIISILIKLFFFVSKDIERNNASKGESKYLLAI